MPGRAVDCCGPVPHVCSVTVLWNFVPYRAPTTSEEKSSLWGWTKVLQSAEEEEYIPGPRLASALAVLPSSSSNSDNNGAHHRAVLFGGWDPQLPGTGGAILDDVLMLDLEPLKWLQCTTTKKNTANDSTEEGFATVPGGPTSCHVAVLLSIKHSDNDEARNVICLHNHRCDNHILLL